MSTSSRVSIGLPAGGQFATTQRTESNLAFNAPFDREAFRVVDGTCINCGHYDDHEFCENCSPTCTKCYQERESADRSLCDDCHDRETEDG